MRVSPCKSDNLPRILVQVSHLDTGMRNLVLLGDGRRVATQAPDSTISSITCKGWEGVTFVLDDARSELIACEDDDSLLWAAQLPTGVGTLDTFTFMVLIVGLTLIFCCAEEMGLGCIHWRARRCRLRGRRGRHCVRAGDDR